MSSAGQGAVMEDPYLRSMKISRRNTAVLKHDLITLRSEVGDLAIFVFEGVDDKVVYHHWVNRINPDLDYEPYVCEGKKYVLRLLEAVNSDLNGLKDGVFFFVGKDFDGANSHPKCDNLFVTDCYAIENYLVSPHTFVGVLRTHFHCSGGIEKRDALVAFFNALYMRFLEVSYEVNFRTYVSRKLGIACVLPDKISKIASVELKAVEPVDVDVKQIVRLERELDVEEEKNLRIAFNELNAVNDYRGKYAYMFLRRWLDLAVKDRNLDEASQLFEGMKTKSKANPVSLDCLASKSKMPKGLSAFIKEIQIA